MPEIGKILQLNNPSRRTGVNTMNIPHLAAVSVALQPKKGFTLQTARSTAVLLMGLLGCLSPSLGQSPVRKSVPTEPARQASLREKAQQMPLQSLIKVKGPEGRTLEARLREVSSRGIGIQVLHERGIESRQIPFDQMSSLSAGIEAQELSNLYARKGLFLVPEGSLVELRLASNERLKGVIEEYSDNEFTFRNRNTKLLFERKTIAFSQVKFFAVKSWANSSVISDPAAFNLLADPGGKETNTALLQDGTPVVVRLRHTISTVDANVGDIVEFDIVEEVKAGGQVVLAKNGAAWGKIAEVVPKRRMGRGARLGFEIEGARTVSGETLPLRATKEAARSGRTATMVGAMVGVGLITAPLPVLTAPLLLSRGADAAVPRGTLMVAYVKGNPQIH